MERTVTLQHRPPTLEEFTVLRTGAGWRMPEDTAAMNGLGNTQYAVCAVTGDNRTVGCARITGDGHMYFYVSDVLVDPDYRGRGIGTKMMTDIMAYLDTEAPAGAFIGLFAAKGREGFYRRFGFIGRPTDTLGQGMVVFKKYPDAE